MRNTLMTAAVAVFVLASLTEAGAVDIVNDDDSPYVLLVDTGEVAKEVEVGGNQTVTGVCEACVVQIGDDDIVEAEGDQIVKIKGGKLKIGG